MPVQSGMSARGESVCIVCGANQCKHYLMSLTYSDKTGGPIHTVEYYCCLCFVKMGHGPTIGDNRHPACHVMVQAVKDDPSLLMRDHPQFNKHMDYHYEWGLNGPERVPGPMPERARQPYGPAPLPHRGGLNQFINADWVQNMPHREEPMWVRAPANEAPVDYPRGPAPYPPRHGDDRDYFRQWNEQMNPQGIGVPPGPPEEVIHRENLEREQDIRRMMNARYELDRLAQPRIEERRPPPLPPPNVRPPAIPGAMPPAMVRKYAQLGVEERKAKYKAGIYSRIKRSIVGEP